MFFKQHKTAMPSPDQALPGRADPMPVPDKHFVLGTALTPPFPDNMRQALFGMGCFWGAERRFWQLGDGIYTTAVGYAGGYTPNPSYEEVCSGLTGHNEVVLVVYDPARIGYRYQQVMTATKGVSITTEIIDAPTFYYAEDYHQQYLAKNPNGYCGLGGTGIALPD